MDQPTEYIGDGVYAIADAYGGIWLHANDHQSPTDKVYLEPAVYAALVRFHKRYLEATSERREADTDGCAPVT